MVGNVLIIIIGVLLGLGSLWLFYGNSPQDKASAARNRLHKAQRQQAAGRNTAAVHAAMVNAAADRESAVHAAAVKSAAEDWYAAAAAWQRNPGSAQARNRALTAQAAAEQLVKNGVSS